MEEERNKRPRGLVQGVYQKIGLFCGTRKMEGEGGVPEGRGVNKRWIPTVVTGKLYGPLVCPLKDVLLLVQVHGTRWESEKSCTLGA